MLTLPKIINTKRMAVAASPSGRGKGKPVGIPVPDHVTDVKSWVERVYGFDFIEVRETPPEPKK